METMGDKKGGVRFFRENVRKKLLLNVSLNLELQLQ